MQRIHQGDLVQVIAGKEKGKKGRVTKILREKQRVIIQGLMLSKRHLKPSQKDPKGSIIDKEGSIHISNVMPLDPKTDRPTRVRYQNDENGKVRLSKSNAEIVTKIDASSKS